MSCIDARMVVMSDFGVWGSREEEEEDECGDNPILDVWFWSNDAGRCIPMPDVGLSAMLGMTV